MRKYIFPALFILAAPCAAELTSHGDAVSALKASAAKERLEAIGYLAAEGNDQAYEALAGHFQAEKDAYLRVQIVEALNVAGSTWAYACAAAAAVDGNQAVRQAAAGAIAQRIGETEADEKLKALAADQSEAVRFSVLNAAAARPGASAAGIAGGVLSDAAAPIALRREAAGALARMKIKEADAELLKHSGDPDKDIKAAVSARTAKPAPAKAKAAPAAKPAAAKAKPAAATKAKPAAR